MIYPNKDPKNLREQINPIIQSVQGSIAVAYLNLEQPSDTLFIRSDEWFHAASTMKTPVLIEAYKQMHALGKSIDDPIVVHNEFKSIVDGSTFSVDLAGDSGKAMHDRIGQRVPLRELLYDMIINSGNLSTNVIIDWVGAEKVTQTLRELGAERMEVLRGVEDLKAFEAGLINRTTARDLAIVFQHLASDTLISRQANKEMIDILLDQQFNEMIPAGLPPDVRVAHKTGWITGSVHDSGIVILPDGRRYILVILTKDLSDPNEGRHIGAQISKVIYEWFLNARP